MTTPDEFTVSPTKHRKRGVPRSTRPRARSRRKDAIFTAARMLCADGASGGSARGLRRGRG